MNIIPLDELLGEAGPSKQQPKSSLNIVGLDEILGPQQAQEQAPERTVLGTVGDVIGVGLKGAMAVPEAAVGLANIVTGGRAGKFVQDIGVDFDAGRKAVDELIMSDAQLAAQKKVNDAEGFTGTVKEMLANPSTIATAVGESVPSILAGGLVGRGVKLLGASRPVAAAVGEGVVAAGSTAENIRQQTDDGLLTLGQSALAATSGVATAGLGRLGSKLANKIGVADIDEMVVDGATKASTRGLLPRVAGGAVAEGVFEEMPQSASEQAFENVALDRPVLENVDKAAAQGLVAGAAMGGGANIRRSRAEDPAAPPVANPATNVAPPATPQVDTSFAVNAFAEVGGSEETLQGQREQQGLIAQSLRMLRANEGDQALVPAIQALSGGDQALAERIFQAVEDPELLDLGRQAMRADAMKFIDLNETIRQAAGYIAEDGQQPPATQAPAAPGAPAVDTSVQPLDTGTLQARVQALREGLVGGMVMSEQEAQDSGVDLSGLSAAIHQDETGAEWVILGKDDATVQGAFEQAATAGIGQVKSALESRVQGRAVVDGQVVAPEQAAQAASSTAPEVRTVDEVLAERMAALNPQPALMQDQGLQQQGGRLSGPRAATSFNEDERGNFFSRKKTEQAKPLPFKDAEQTGALKSLIESINRGNKLEGDQQIDLDSVREVAPTGPMARFAQALPAAFGVKVVLVDAPNGLVRKNGERFNTFNGIADRRNKTIFIAATANAPLNVMGHELAHIMETEANDIYDEMEMAVLSRLRAPAAKRLRESLQASMSAEGLDGAEIGRQFRQEVVAEAIGEMANDQTFWEDIFSSVGQDGTKAKTLYQKAMDIIAKLQRALTKAGFITGIRDVAEAKKAVTAAYKAWGQRYERDGENEDNLTADGKAMLKEFKRLAEKPEPPPEPIVGRRQAKEPPKDDAEATMEGEGGGVLFARKRESVGEFEVSAEKDGSLTVYGEPEKIRGLMPVGVTGRVVAGGVRFVTSDAPRVRGALGGSKLAYSREGQVLDKLPMKDGKYLGAPPGYDTPAKITGLRRILRQLTKEGERGRFWYENSSKAILRMVDGNVQEARKFVALLAIYSPQAKVDANSTFALRAWAQYKAGQPIRVKTVSQDAKATAAMQDVDAFWSGEKTGNFFHNLLREIDPATAGKQGATIDMWMMRAGQYPTDAPTKTQYAFMENETNRIAQELGWEPQQVQAAIWVAMKARMENDGVKKRAESISEKKGWIKYTYPVKNGRPVKTRVILDAQKYRDNWLAQSMKHVPTQEDSQRAKFDFEDGVRRHIGQISFEARPGRSTGVLPGIHSAPYAQQVEFQQAVQQAFYNDQGVDELAERLGLLVDSNTLAPGVWQGEVSPSNQKGVAMAPAAGKDGVTNVDPAQKRALNTYAAVAGLVAKQEGVGWHRPFYASTKRDANGLDIDIGRPLNPMEAVDLERAIDTWMRDNGKPEWADSFAIISSPRGVRLVSFGAVDNTTLQGEFLKGVESVLPDYSYRTFASDGDMPTNNWKEQPDGQGYVQRIRAEGRSDVLDWARDVLAPRVQDVFDDFSKRYDWGDPGAILFSRSDAAVPGKQPAPVYGRRQQEDAVQVTAWHFSGERRQSLVSAAFGSGLKGSAREQFLQAADPRSRKRIYFYVDKGNGIHPEAGVGGSAHEVSLKNVYDFDADPRGLKRGSDWQAFETALMDAGFDGYLYRQHNLSAAVVLIGDHVVPVAYRGVGKAVTHPGGGVVEPSTEEDWKTQSTGSPEMLRAKLERMRASPSWSGYDLRIEGDSLQTRKKVEPAVLFSRAPATDTPEFKRWFKNSKVVNRDGSPKVMYHGTARDITAFRAKQAGAIFVTPDPGFADGFADASAYYMAEKGVEALTPEQKRLVAEEVSRRIDGEYPDDPDIAGKMKSDVRVWSIPGAYFVPGGELLDYINEAAQQYLDSGENIMPLYVSAQNPFDYEDRAQVEALTAALARNARVSDVTQYAQSNREMIKAIMRGDWSIIEAPNVQRAIRDIGHDGFYVEEGAVKNLAVYKSSQLKSVTGNRGTYDPESDDIRFSRVGVTSTPEFRRWFGDSKVVDESGKPLVVYHGSDADFDVFEYGEEGFHFGTEAQASTMGGNVRQFYLSAKRLFRFDADLQNWNDIDSVADYLRGKRKISAAEYREFPGLQDWLESKGYDGYVYPNGYEGAGDSFAVFRPEQIKSAIGNDGTFDPGNPDIRFSRATKLDSVQEILDFAATGRLPMHLDEALRRRNWADAYMLAKDPAERKRLLGLIGDKVIETWADSRIKVQRWIEGLPLAESFKAKLEGDLRRSDTVRSALEKDVREDFVDPMFKAVSALAKATGLSSDQAKKMVGIWMSARYVPEANALLIDKDRRALRLAQQAGDPAEIAKAQANLQARIQAVTGAVRQAGVKSPRGLAGGMNDAEATQAERDIVNQIVNRLQASKTAYANPQQSALKLLDDAAKPVYDMLAWKKALDLKSGKVNQTTVNSWRNSPRYVPLTGDPRSSDEMSDVFSGGNMINQDKDYAIDGRTESVADDGIDAAFGAVIKSVNFAAIQDFKRSLNKAFEDAQAAGIDIGLERGPVNALSRLGDNVIIYRDTRAAQNGLVATQSYAFRFADKAIGEALRRDNEEHLNALLSGIATPTRWYGRLVTQFMPMFAPVNFVRDLWERSELLRTRKIYDAAGVEINVKKAAREAIAESINPAIWRATVGKAFNVGGKNPVRDDLEEMIRLGGTSTWGDYLSRRASDTEAELRREGILTRAGDKAMFPIEGYNNAFEFVPSLTIYRALKAQGVTPSDAAAASLDLMNFRKRGTIMPAVRALYVFAQPAATSGYNLARYLSTKTGQKRFLGYTITGVALYSMLQSLWGGGDDEEEIGNQLDNLSNFTIERTIPIKLGEHMVKIPVGFGAPQLSWATAGILSRLNSGRYDTSDAIAEMAKAWVKSAAPIAPSEMEVSNRPVDFFVTTFTPTVVKPLMNIAMDVTGLGAPLTPQFKNPSLLKSEQAKRSTAPEYVEVARMIQETTGVDLYPDYIKALSDGYLIGPMREIIRWTVENPAKEFRGEKASVPLVSSVVDSINDRAILNSVYYRIRDEMEEGHRKFGSYSKDPERRHLIDADMIRAEGLHKQFSAAERALGVQRNAIRKSQMDDETKSARLQILEEQADEVRRRLIREYVRSMRS